MNTTKFNQFLELSTTDLQVIIGGKHGVVYHITDAVVSFGKGFLNAF